MINLLFLISLGLLLLSLLLSVGLRRFPRATGAALLFFTCSTLLLLGLLLLQKLYHGQMTFLNPGFLWLLIIPKLLLLLQVFCPQRFQRPLDYPLTGALPDPFSLAVLGNRHLPRVLGLVGLALFIVALARPMTIRTDKLPPTQGIDIMLVLDTSASMANRDFYPSRFVAAQKTAINFIGKRFNDRIGLTLFAKNASLAAPLTLDHEAVKELVASLFIGVVDPTLTAIGDALGVAASHLKDSTAKSKVILLLTDGSNNAGALDPLLSAKAAAAYGIKVYTIATASPPGSTLFSSAEDEIDEGLLMNIAKETGGEFYRAKNELELQEIYNQINALEKTDFTQAARVSRSDMYRPFLLWGLILLLLGLALRQLVLIRVPDYGII